MWLHVILFQLMLEEHAGMKRRINKAPVEALDTDGQRILERIGAAPRTRSTQGQYSLHIRCISVTCVGHSMNWWKTTCIVAF